MIEQKTKIWDIHTHIIPGVDDGSDSLETTWFMVNSMYKNGVRGIFATPHSEYLMKTPKSTREKYQKTVQRLRSSFPDLEIRMGCEMYCDLGKVEESLSALDSGVLPTMNGTRFVLVEFYSGLLFHDICTCVEQFLSRGYIPIIAHVERYRDLYNRVDRVRRLREMGCKIQLCMYSLEEYGETKSRDWSRLLIEEQFVDYLATDCHNFWVRLPSIAGGMEYLKKHCSTEYLEQITWKNAQTDFG